MRIKRQARFYLVEKIFTRKMVIPRTLIRKEVVFYSWKQTTRRMGQIRRNDEDQIQWKWTPSFPFHDLLSRGTLRSKGGEKLSIHLRWWGNDWNWFSHNYFCYSAQYLRSSLRVVWRIQILPCKNREACFGRTVWPIVCAKCDEDKHTFDRWSCTRRRSIAKVPRTRGKAITTK